MRILISIETVAFGTSTLSVMRRRYLCPRYARRYVRAFEELNISYLFVSMSFDKTGSKMRGHVNCLNMIGSTAAVNFNSNVMSMWWRLWTCSNRDTDSTDSLMYETLSTFLHFILDIWNQLPTVRISRLRASRFTNNINQCYSNTLQLMRGPLNTSQN